MLKNILYVSAIFTLICLGAMCVQITRSMHAIELQTVQSLKNVNLLVEKISQDAEDTKQMTNATLYQISDAAHVLADTERQQQKYWDQLGKESVKTLEYTNQVLQSLDSTTNHLDNESVVALQNLSGALASSKQALDNSSKAIESANKLLSDPSIPETLHHIDATSKSVQNTTATIDRTITKLTKPQSIVKSIFTKALGIASQVATLFK